MACANHTCGVTWYHHPWTVQEDDPFLWTDAQPRSADDQGMDQKWEEEEEARQVAEAQRMHEESERQKAEEAARQAPAELTPPSEMPVEGGGLSPAPAAGPVVPPLLPNPAPVQGHDGMMITSTTHRREWATLTRVASGPRAESFPELSRLFNGTKADKLRVLREFVTSGCNLEAVEANVVATRAHRERLQRTRKLMTVREMREAHFTEVSWMNCLNLLNQMNLLHHYLFKSLCCRLVLS